mmetsp:Transcript_21172/g.18785  ORF Transcript_21172/g.18785 Transcript_21172/m.18785 type:complete len:95 (-) Transcript_21172:701-985(-)
MIHYEDQHRARNFIFSSKACLILIQTLLIICAAVIEDKYVLFCLPVFEFLIVLSGISTRYLKICAFQVLIHIWGCVLILFTIVEKIDIDNILLI